MEDFYFKKFTIKHDLSAMKVGTDSVLLGAWVDPTGYNSALDIGTGSGILALMLAQKNPGIQIHALEIDKDTCEEARHNFTRSPWRDNILCHHDSLYSFAENFQGTFDIIISNPPYYDPSHIIEATGRNIARTTMHLTHVSLLRHTADLLNVNGFAAFIIPTISEPFFINLAQTFGLFPGRITRIKDKYDSPYKRSLLRFLKNETKTLESELILKDNNNKPTEEYIKWVRPFLLNY